MGYDLKKALKGGPGLAQQQVSVRGKTKVFQRKQWKRTGPVQQKKEPYQAKGGEDFSSTHDRVKQKLENLKNHYEQLKSSGDERADEVKNVIDEVEGRLHKVEQAHGIGEKPTKVQKPESKPEGEYEPVIVQGGKVVHAGKGHAQETFKKQYGKLPEIGMDASEQGGAKGYKKQEEEKGKADVEEIKRFETKQKEEGTHPSEQQKAEWKAKKETSTAHQKKLMEEFKGEGVRQTKAETSEHPKNTGDFVTVGGKKIKIVATGEHGFTGYDEKGNRHQVKWDQLKDYGEEKETGGYGEEAEQPRSSGKVVYESKKAEVSKEPYKAKKKGFFQRFREGS